MNKKYVDCKNCIYRVVDEKTYLSTPNMCLVTDEELESLKNAICEYFERKEER